MDLTPLDSSQRGRIYLATAVSPTGQYEGSTAYRLWQPCQVCGPRPTSYNPDPEQVAPCRTPHSHATNLVRVWRRIYEGSGRSFILLAPHADTLAEAEAYAARMSRILTRPVQRTTQHA
ncbi:hypothetical protein ACIRBY_37255 [Streptomyces sp. NPDC096136]|uniref:hypothetical protein n=1 Tax=Streptomyces sp. NPDC096136 TaxID=3366076 RepID=UPI003805D405